MKFSVFSKFLLGVIFGTWTVGNSKILCSVYTCKRPNDYFLPTTCIYYDTSGAIPGYYANSCNDKQNPYCPSTFQANSTCTAASTSESFKYPGEKCVVDADCLNSFKCDQQTCTGISENQLCTGHEFCSPGLRCNKTCVKQLESEEFGCQTDYDCLNSYGCDISNISLYGSCKKY